MMLQTAKQLPTFANRVDHNGNTPPTCIATR